ncbi:MAG: ComF family protein [Flavobacteriaceae bacterium]|jgi:ComF family protein
MHFRRIKNVLQTLLNPIFPKSCFGCEALLVKGEEILCAFCRHELPLSGYHFGVENNMDKALYGRFEFKKAAALFFYNKEGILKHCLQYLKYRKQDQISYFLGLWHAQILKKDPFFPVLDFIIPVPLHPKKKRKRGYNQLNGYGGALSQVLGVPFLENAVIKTANTKTQTRKNRGLRFLSDSTLFKLRDSHIFNDKKILLIDDVMTTGATLEQFSSAFKDCESSSFYIVTLAFVP